MARVQLPPPSSQSAGIDQACCKAPFTDGCGAARWAPGRRWKSKSSWRQTQAGGWEVSTMHLKACALQSHGRDPKLKGCSSSCASQGADTHAMDVTTETAGLFLESPAGPVLGWDNHLHYGLIAAIKGMC